MFVAARRAPRSDQWRLRPTVDEHQAGGVEVELALEPFPPPSQDVGPILLGRMHRFFQRDPPSREEPPERRDADRHAGIGPFRAQLAQCDVRRPLQQPEDQRRMRLDPSGATVAAERPGCHRTSLPVQRQPADRTRCPDTEPVRRRATRRARRNRRHHPFPQINR
jgi:hypothetical protein